MARLRLVVREISGDRANDARRGYRATASLRLDLSRRVGFPTVADHVSLWGLLIPIRREFDQYINLRPVRLFEAVPCPLIGKAAGDIDFYFVRENVEGKYSAIGGMQYEGTERELVVQQNIFSRYGVDRVLKYAFELAQTRSAKRLTSGTKSNGIIHSMPYWDSRVDEMARQYRDITVEHFHIDILTAHFVRMPEHFDVVVGSNLFATYFQISGPPVQVRSRSRRPLT